MILIFIRGKIKLLKIRDFIFESISFDIIKSKREVTTIIIDVYTVYIEIRNITDKSVIIDRKKRLKTIEEYGTEKCYLITKKSRSLIIERIL
jgi:hypothetical protein